MLLSESLRNSGRQHTKESGLEWTPQSATWSLQVSTGRLYCAAFARHCFALGGGSNCPSQYLCGDHDAVGTRLAVCVRLCLSSRVECGRVCRGVLAAKFSIPTRLPRCHQPPVPWAVNNLAQPLGSKISLSTQTGGRTEHLRFGCRTLLLRLPACHRAFCARPRRRASSASPPGRSRSTVLLERGPSTATSAAASCTRSTT